MSNYCKHLYDETTDGYIHLIKINENKTVKIYNTTNAAVKEVVEEFNGASNVFVTPNTTYKPERGVNNIRQFRALYIDIDGIEGDQLYVSYKIFELVELEKIPKPTMIVDSGRGIHVYWRIKNAPYGALYTWQELEDMLYQNLKEYGADIKATDGARVLRLPGTINSKNNQECRIIYQDDELEYSMYDLRDKYLNYKNKKQIGKAIKENKKIVTNAFFNSYSLHIARAEDLETLCNLRDYDIKGHRNMVLHCYTYWIGIYERDSESLAERVNVLNNKFIEPAKDSEVKAILRCVPKAIEKFLEYEQGIRAGKDKRVTKGMRDKGGYWYKNETLIERLDITEAEQKHMKTIIGIRVKYDRKNNKRNEARRNENGLTEKQQELEDLKIKVTELKKKGYNNSQIAKELKVNRTKVIRILKAI
ncbi:MAG: DNA-primase RepB domain-containing protein [Romboutsia sp.]|uniref:DNA-primase RepB domain-containing protein n=1 Tax=Romboutsia sp. TaxID=1965302 RepID=UPI003F2F6EA1